MQRATEIAIEYAQLLRRSRTQHAILEIDVSRKGGPPAQTLKRIALGRLTHATGQGPLIRLKGDLFRYLLNGEETSFRFAVTASKGALPWFNITETELRKLNDSNSILLVLWNPDDSVRWCNTIVVFSLTPSGLLEGYKANASRIIQSMLRATKRKLEVEEDHLPGLRQLIDQRLDCSVVDQTDLSLSALLSCREAFAAVIDEFRDSTIDASPDQMLRKNRLRKLREKLYTLLLRIEPVPASEVFTVGHHKTGSSLLQLNSSVIAEVALGREETQAMQRAYEYPTVQDHAAHTEGIENEELDDSGSTILRPYDATKSKIDTRTVTIDLLAKRIKGSEIDLAPDFQRKAGLWSHKQKSQLIESLLIRIPLPAFYFDATDDSRWLVVDGLQRLTTFNDFLLENMQLEGLEYLTPYEGKTFADLPRALQRIIEESQVTVHLIQPGTPPEVKFNIFRRINTGGLALTLQEIRHALNQGPVTKLLEKLAGSVEFLEATTHSISSERMADRELVLRFLAFTVTSYTDYRTPDMDSFLTVEMARLNRMTVQYPMLSERFLQCMRAAKEIFGNQAFRKMYYLHQNRSPINKALFEAWSVSLGNLTPEQLSDVERKKERVLSDFIVLMNDDDFHRAISQGTQDVAKVRKRFEAVGKLLSDVL